MTEITFIRTDAAWRHLCSVLDLYPHFVVGWSMSNRHDRQLVMQAALRALWQRDPSEGVILHSDRGCQGEFKWSSQHLYLGGVAWDDQGVG